jgi:broad specificity phosphatase PhoE
MFGEAIAVHLLLVRHGQSFVNLDDWEGGYVDAGLTPLGQRQAAFLGEWIAENIEIHALYSSTMARSLETAAYIARATGVILQPDDRLREFGNCYSNGQAVPLEAMPIQYPEFWGTERPYTQISSRGESWMLFRIRVGTFLDDVIERHRNNESEMTVVVVCHGGVIDAVFDYIFNVGAHRRVEVLTHNTGIVHLEYRHEPGREPWRLHAHGLVHHLMTDAGEWLGSRAILRDASRKSVGPQTGE